MQNDLWVVLFHKKSLPLPNSWIFSKVEIHTIHLHYTHATVEEEEAVDLIKTMKRDGAKPNRVAYTSAISACANSRYVPYESSI